jgi:uncharacterized protein YdeI (YjbR/CyaY-like superfamily)
MEPVFFKDSLEFRKWLENNHDKADELWVGYYKVSTGIPSITWPESVDEALCYGWIDGLRKSIDEKRYRIRFTPRRTNSNWSEVNLKRVKVLKEHGRMQPAGLVAHGRRKKGPTAYSYQADSYKLSKEYEDDIRANKTAWEFLNTLSPSIRKRTMYWVMSAKKEETRRRRLAILIDSSAKREKIPPLIISKKT